MNKEYKIKLDLNKKLYNKKMTFNQFDENVNDFYIEITKNNEVVKNLDKSIVTLVAIKPNGEVDAQFIEVKEGQIYADLKPSMCDLVGNYQAKAIIVLDGEIVTTDTINYSVNEDKIISKLNEDVVSDERFTLFTDALARLSDIESSEEQRVINEAERILAEEERNANYNFMTEDEERRRSEANAHKEAEVLRVQAETNRVNEEAKRRTTEQARVSAENIRVSNENTRKANEETRQNNETKRVEAETQRQNRYNSFIADAEANANNFENYTNNAKVKEEERKANELDRKSQEVQRISNENERISNENSRKANEVVREENEISRQGIFEDKVDEFNEKIVELNTTKENFVSSINTKVDTKISELDNAKSDMTNTVSNKVNEVETRFNRLTSSQQQDAEVIDARDGETSLKARLDRDIEKAKQVYVNVEGSHISTDSSSGYAKNVEILGNTIQSASNLADIRSVGDKVEGQELYEIPVLSVGGNLFNINSEYEDNLFYFYSTGNKVNDTSRRSYIVPVKEGMSVKYINSKDIHVTYYTKDGIYISGEVAGDSRVRVVPKGTYFAKFGVRKDVGYEYGKLCVCESSFANDYYEPYQEDKLTILSPVQLEKVGDVADRIIEKDGVWGVEKNVNNGFIPSNASWLLQRNNGVVNRFVCLTSNMPFTDFIRATNNVITNKFIATANLSDYTIGCMFGNNDGFIVHANIQDIPTLVDFKNFIGDGVYVKYPTTNPQFIPLPHDQQVKLRTFASKTNISFLTEIEGTIKAQVPKSIGATVNTHTEQIRSLNNELNRVKKLEESTVSTVTTESDFTTVEATSNGYFEDVKLEGKTLVNLCDITLSNVRWSGGNGSDNWMHTQYSMFDRLSVGKEYTMIVFGDIKNFKVWSFGHANGLSPKQIADGKLNIPVKFVCKEIVSPGIGVVFTKSVTEEYTQEEKKSIKIIILEGDHTQNPPSYFEGLKSVGEDVDEIVVSSVNNGNLFDGELELGSYNNNDGTKADSASVIRSKNYIPTYGMRYLNIIGNEKPSDGQYRIFKYDENKNYLGTFLASKTEGFELESNVSYITFHNNTNGNLDLNIIISSTREDFSDCVKSDKKRLLYYNNETQAWEKPILREWDSIEKHADGKYYYHVRSVEEDYTEGDETVSDYITDMTITVKPLAQEKIYECTNIDLITYANETNYIVESGAIVPRTTLKVHNNISNVVSLLQKKVSLLESNVKASQEVQDMMILETDMRMLDIELALMEFMPMTLNLGGSNMLRSATYFNFLKNHIINETYEKEYLENVMNKYLATGRINQDEYNELYKMLYPPVYDIELPIEY